MLSILVLFIGILAASTHSVHGSREECRTPDDKDGFCIHLLQCKSLLSVLYDTEQKPEHKIFLRKSRCGETDNLQNVHVCCPKDQIDADPISQSNGLLPSLNFCGMQKSERWSGVNLDSCNQTEIGDFSWTARLFYTNLTSGESSSHCSGSLINDEYVLTAAHCVDPSLLELSGLNLTSVRLGEWNTNTDTDCDCSKGPTCHCAEPHQDIDVAEVIVHEKYFTIKSFHINDIALIRLSKKLEKFTDYVNPICLPHKYNSSNSNSNNNVTVAVGWGDASRGHTSDVRIKQNLQINEDQCNEAYDSQFTRINFDLHICAGGNNYFDTCISDGGAQLVRVAETGHLRQNWQLIGITTFQPEQCELTGYPGIYTRVSNYTDWIVDQLIEAHMKSSFQQQ